MDAADHRRRDRDAAPAEGLADRAAIPPSSARRCRRLPEPRARDDRVSPAVLADRIRRADCPVCAGPRHLAGPAAALEGGADRRSAPRRWRRRRSRLPASLAAARALEFHHVRAEGVFSTTRRSFSARTSEGGERAFTCLTPLGPDGRIVLVDRGFVPTELKDRAKRDGRRARPAPCRSTGLLRLPPDGRPTGFSRTTAPTKLLVLGRPAGDGGGRRSTMWRRSTSTPTRRPIPAAGRKAGRPTRLPNNHLQYAITWYALAVALVVIYILFASPHAERRMTAYQQLEARFRRLGALGEALGVLHWDSATMMPDGGADARAEQLATLKLHRPRAADRCRRCPICSPAPRARTTTRSVAARQSARDAAPLAARDRGAGRSGRGGLARASPTARWCGARRARRTISPPCCRRSTRCCALTREVAAAKAAALGISPYDALLDQYEPGGSSADDRPPVRRLSPPSARPDRRRAGAAGGAPPPAAAAAARSRSRRSARRRSA